VSWSGFLAIWISAATCLAPAAPAHGDADSDLVSKVPRNPVLNQALLDVVENPSTDDVLNQAGDAQKVRDLLAQGADPNAKAKNGTSALTSALLLGKDESARFLIRYGADIHEVDRKGCNLAWTAARRISCPGALELLIKKGLTVTGTKAGVIDDGAVQGTIMLDIMEDGLVPEPGYKNWPGDRIWTDVDYQAYLKRQRRTLDLVIAAGADFNGKDGKETPLIHSINDGNYPVAQYLLEHGVNISFKDEYGQTALSRIFTSEESRFSLAVLDAILQRGGDANASTIFNNNPVPRPLLEIALEMASVHRTKDSDPSREAVKLLLDHGAIFIRVADDKVQALLQAAARCDLVALQKVVQNGTSINSANGHGWTPLMIATALGWNDGSEWLIAHGADVGSRDKGAAHDPPAKKSVPAH
jgi:ankyrin repeat protein